MKKKKSLITSWHVAVAAEAFAAGMFARAGFDVSVQYGADQPEYDLVVSQSGRLAKVSVKGSRDGRWGLTQSYLSKANYHGAADAWMQHLDPRIILCFVQFKDVSFDELPRFYLARPFEVSGRLKAACGGGGSTVLYEKHVWTAKAKGAGTIEEIPANWKFSPERATELLHSI